MSTEDPDLEPPLPSHGDHLHQLVRAVLSGVPIVGGPAVELFQALVVPPLQRRQDVWMTDVARTLVDLHKRHVLDLQALQDNPEFLDVVFAASAAAIRRGGEDKRRALCAAVANAAMGLLPGEVETYFFLDLIESFTTLHIKTLKFFSDPAAWLAERGIEVSSGPSPMPSVFFFPAFPELRDEKDAVQIVMKDLRDAGLLTLKGMYEELKRDNLLQKRTAPRGDRFLLFITEPS
jgi:hypothetical protein